MFKKLYSNSRLLLFLCILTTLIVLAFILGNVSNSDGVVFATKGESAKAVPLPTPSVTIGVATYTSSENHKCYQYNVENNSGLPIVGVDIGLDQDSGTTQLNSLPRGWSVDDSGAAVHDSSIPTMVEVFTAEESDQVYITTAAFRANSGEARGFSVCMQSKWDQTYKTSKWNAYYMDGTSVSGSLVDLGPL